MSLHAWSTLWTLFERTSDVHRDAATTNFLIVEHLDRFVSTFLVNHLNEGETTRAAGHAVHRDEYIRNATSLLERSAKFINRHAVRNTANKQFYCHVVGSGEVTLRKQILYGYSFA